MSVPIPCPNCSADHLHAAVYLDAERGDRFEVVAVVDDEDLSEAVVVARVNEAGTVTRPEEAHLSCCACDWAGDQFIRWMA